MVLFTLLQILPSPVRLQQWLLCLGHLSVFNFLGGTFGMAHPKAHSTAMKQVAKDEWIT